MIKVGDQYIGIENKIIFTITKVSNKSVSLTYLHEDRVKKGNITKEHLFKHMRSLVPYSIQYMRED
jgi:hypothetical protein